MASEAGDQAAFDPVEFGVLIATRRRSLHIPQDKLAERIGISRVQLQNIESGWSDRSKGTPSNPRLSTLLGLCRELGGTIDVAYPGGVMIVFDEDESE